MNYINYFNHAVFTPDTYYRRYDFDLPQKEVNQVKRIALLALPFISLYRPFGSIISVGMGSCRAFSHLSEAFTFEQRKEWGNLSVEMAQTAVATIAVATTIFGFTAGLFITTIADVIQEISHLIRYAKEKKYDKVGEEALQLLASGLYLAFMATGILEVILLSTLIQGIICLYQAHDEIVEGRYLEAFAKMALAVVRFHQTEKYRLSIERRDALFALKKYQALIERAIKGKQARHLIHDPLSDLQGSMEKKRVILREDLDFGSHFHGYGKGVVKGANLAFRTVVKDGKELTELEFKVNHVFRDRLQHSLEDLAKLKGREVQDILHLTGSHVESIDITRETMSDCVTLKGLGKISICGLPDLPNLYDKVIIQMDSNKTIYDLHEILAFTNLEEALFTSSKEDLDRLKMGHLFRTFFPKEALPFERSEEFFTLSLEALKEEMVKKAPAMEQVFTTHFDQIREAEILPGRVRYQIGGLADKVRECGGRALTSAVTGAYNDDRELYKRVASMLQMGMISNELKDIYGLRASGLGSDYWTGGADSVYTQMITQKNIEEGFNLSKLYHSKVRMLISLEALETGTYQYYDDSFGTRIFDDEHFLSWGESSYTTRPDILEFTKQLQHSDCSWKYNRNEVMIKERLDPKYFTGIVLNSEETRAGLLNHLRTQDLVKQDESGRETILNIDVDRFLRVGKFATEELIR
jgi:hypothetical protein